MPICLFQIFKVKILFAESKNEKNIKKKELEYLLFENLKLFLHSV